MDVSLPSHLTTTLRRADLGQGRRATPQPLAVGLFNDSGDTPHVVGLASSEAHRRLLRRAGGHVRHAYFRGDWHELGAGTLDEAVAAALAAPELRRVFADVDVVVVMGDTFASRPSRHLLAILGAAQHLDLPTYLVSASIGACPDGQEILHGLTDCTVRDAASARALKALGIPHRASGDPLASAGFSADPARDFADHLVVTDCEPARRTEFTTELAAVRAAWPGLAADYPLDATSSEFGWRHAVADLATASAVLTGGRDGAALALAAGVPFVVLGHDRDSAPLVEMLEGYPAEAADTSRSLDARLRAALAARAWFALAGAAWSRGASETYSRLRPSLALTGRDDTWTASIESTVDVVQALTPAGGSVLHAGAGQGQLVETLSKAGFRSWGADVARRLDRPDRTRYSKATPTALPFADHVFSTVVVSADWLEHLEPEDLDTAVAELTRVAKDSIAIEISGRPLRTGRAFDEHLDDDWWQRRLSLAGLGTSERADTLITRGAGPTGGTLLVMRAQAHLCPNCRRAHGPADHIEPVHAGVLQAAAHSRGALARR